MPLELCVGACEVGIDYPLCLQLVHRALLESFEHCELLQLKTLLIMRLKRNDLFQFVLHLKTEPCHTDLYLFLPGTTFKLEKYETV